MTRQRGDSEGASQGTGPEARTGRGAEQSSSAPHIVVVGGGICGLAGAHRLRKLLGERARITVVEQADSVGGKLRTVKLAGVDYDVGAEAFLVRRPEAFGLVGELGLTERLVHPTPARPGLRVGDRTVPLPCRTVLGVPAAMDGLDGVLSTHGLAEARAEAQRPLRWSGGDAAVGALVTERFGAEVNERLVDPLLGGVYAGRTDALGLRATMPALVAELDAAAAAGRPSSLTAAAAAVLRNESDAPVFGALRGGMRILLEALCAAARASIRCGLPVRGLTRAGAGWLVEIGAAGRPEIMDADAVLLAVPAPALRRLLAPLSPAAAAAADIEVASSVIVALALPSDVELPEASGALVAGTEPLRTKAFTYSSRKWAHLRGGHTLVRASLGRHGEATALHADDGELVKIVLADLATLTGVTAEPADVVVARWGGGLPQYAVGHVDRVAAIEAGVAQLPGLAVAGAALRGVGIAACLGTADAAARRIADQLRTVAAWTAWPG